MPFCTPDFPGLFKTTKAKKVRFDLKLFQADLKLVQLNDDPKDALQTPLLCWNLLFSPHCADKKAAHCPRNSSGSFNKRICYFLPPSNTSIVSDNLEPDLHQGTTTIDCPFLSLAPHLLPIHHRLVEDTFIYFGWGCYCDTFTRG